MRTSQTLRISRLILTIATMVVLANCVSKTKAPKPDSHRLFPNGIYSQSVYLNIEKSNGELINFPFRSLSKIEHKQFEIIGLTPFGTKAFEAKGDLDQPEAITIEFFIKKPKFLKDQLIKNTLTTIQAIQNLNRKELVRNGPADQFDGNDFLLEIFDYSQGDIPQTLRLTTNTWKADIKLLSYKKLESGTSEDDIQ